MGVSYGGGYGSSGGPGRASGGTGAFGTGSKSSINPHGLKTQTLNWLSSMSMNPPQVTTPTKTSAINIPNVYSAGSDIFRIMNRERLMGKDIERDYRMTGQDIDIAEEDLRKKKILYEENLAGRGLTGKMREGKPAADWMYEGRQQQIDLARVRQHETKKRWKRQRLHRILFG